MLSLEDLSDMGRALGIKIDGDQVYGDLDFSLAARSKKNAFFADRLSSRWKNLEKFGLITSPLFLKDIDGWVWGVTPLGVAVLKEFCETPENYRIQKVTELRKKLGMETYKTDAPQKSEKGGLKLDSGKPKPSLIPFGSLNQIVDVLTFGANKYSADGWKSVPNGKQRYTDALLRHIFAWTSGETNDPESGLHHLAHAGCCILFLLWYCETEENRDVDKSIEMSIKDRLKSTMGY